MPGLGLGHWWILLIIAALALIIFGPSRLPELGAGLGRAIREFRKGAAEMTESLKEEATKPTDSATGTTYPPVESGKPDEAEPAVKPSTPDAATPTEAPKG
jgi:TatA/E family protein of Tat protein translocase